MAMAAVAYMEPEMAESSGGKRWKWREGTGGNAVAATSGRRVAAEGRVAIITIFYSPPAPPLASLYIGFRLGPPGK
jgi:hypothetical protein